MATEQLFSDFCIYTMRHEDELKRVHQQRKGKDTFTEKRKWVTGRQLFLEAQRHGLKMPIVFSAANVVSGLIYHAIVENIEIDDKDPENPTTTYSFANLTPIKAALPFHSLTLKSTKKRLSDNYIRPYAICYTPSFIMECDNE